MTCFNFWAYPFGKFYLYGAFMLFFLEKYITDPEDYQSRLDSKMNMSIRDSKRYLKLSLPGLAVIATFLSCSANIVRAQTFDQASTNELNKICNDPFKYVTPGSQLNNICFQLFPAQIGGGLNGASSGVGTQSQPNSILITEQLKKKRINKAKRGLDSEVEDVTPGGSADMITAEWGRFSTFLTAGATALHHRQNDFEQGYDATIPSVTAGGGYRISDSLETGLAFNYWNSNGGNTTGGGFDVNSYSPLFYVNYLPFDNAFANLVLGYTRMNQSNKRFATATNLNPIPAQPITSISRLTTGKLNTNQYSLSFLTGYDHPIENFTIGPRAGLDMRQWEMDGYNESTNTGLELRYNNQYQTSIQSSLGLTATSAHSFPFGVILPQLTVSWVHEYTNNSRTIHANFIQAPGSSGFDFQTEHPARNWALIDLGISFVMPHGVQAFANLSTVQGNRNFQSYGGNMGLRVGW